jgi:REP element-mobilizing transposase RayT
MFRISKDSPAFYLTSVTHKRLPIFRTPTITQIACDAIAEARAKYSFLLFAYVIMLDHLHLVTDSELRSTEILRYVNGRVGRRVIDHLKDSGHNESLEKLRINDRSDGSKYTIWQRHPDARLLWSEQMLWQRIQYTHLNPVRAGLVEHPNDWPWSSARIWHGRRSDIEPLEVDKNKLEWRR